jgi:hypothetical protein
LQARWAKKAGNPGLLANFHERHQWIEWIVRHQKNKNTNRLRYCETIKIFTRKIKPALIDAA